MLFEFLSSQVPFTEPTGDENKLFEVIKKGKFDFKNEFWKNISPEAKDLVVHLLDTDPKKRFSMTQVKEHSWLQEH